MHVENKTPFDAQRFVVEDAAGRDMLVVVVKATYRFDERGATALAEEQVPLAKADSHYGEPGQSSTREESDFAPFKPASDVALIGDAWAPRGRATEMDVALRVGPVAQRCRVFGERRWVRGILGYRPSAPEAFERMPLVYERAFGGSDTSPKRESDHAWEPANPVGCGLFAKHSQLDPRELALPNVEDPDDLLRGLGGRPTPAGFGFVGRHWQPRLHWAGSYDAAWQKQRSPLLPLDFDERFHNAAHPRLICPGYLRGDERVELVGVTRAPRVAFSLPGVRVAVRTVTRDLVRTDLPARLDTLVIEPDESRVTLVWRAREDVSRRLHGLEMVRVTSDG